MFTRNIWGKEICTEVDTDTCTKLHQCKQWWYWYVFVQFVQSVEESYWDSCLPRFARLEPGHSIRSLASWCGSQRRRIFKSAQAVWALDHFVKHLERESETVKEWGRSLLWVFARMDEGEGSTALLTEHRIQQTHSIHNQVAFISLVWYILFPWYFFSRAAAGCADESGWTCNRCASRWASALASC